MKGSSQARQERIFFCLIFVAFNIPAFYANDSTSGISPSSNAISITNTVMESQSSTVPIPDTASSVEPSPSSDFGSSVDAPFSSDMGSSTIALQSSEAAEPSSSDSPTSVVDASPFPDLSSSTIELSAAGAEEAPSASATNMVQPSDSSITPSSSGDNVSPSPTQISIDMSSSETAQSPSQDIVSSMAAASTAAATAVMEESTINSQPTPSLASSLNSISESPTPIASPSSSPSSPSSSSPDSVGSTTIFSSSLTTEEFSASLGSSASMPGTASTSSASIAGTESSVTGTSLIMAPSSTQSAGGEVSSTAAPTTMRAPTTTVTTISPTTVQNTYAILKPEKDMELIIPVDNSMESAVYCTNTCNKNAILKDVEEEFKDVPGYLYARITDSTTTRRRRAVQFAVLVVFDAQVMAGLSEDNVTTLIYQAFDRLQQNSTSLTVQMATVNDTIIANFAQLSSDICNLPDACPLGYTCEDARCYHTCEPRYIDCGAQGNCKAIVHTDNTASAVCECKSDDQYRYSGPRCESKEEISGHSDNDDAKVVGAVLGTLCAIMLLVIIYLCRRLCCSEGLSRRKYQMGGYSNGGYGEQEFDMKTSSSASP